MKKPFKIIVLLAMLLTLNTRSGAQPEWNDDPIDTPIDGGLSLLLTSAIGLGLQSLRKKK
ncbi:MAG: hypothetical protein SGJ00_03125 [bacterium]|nr:hypothetical protein [bacterium]